MAGVAGAASSPAVRRPRRDLPSDDVAVGDASPGDVATGENPRAGDPPEATVGGVAIARAVGPGELAVRASPTGRRAADSVSPVDASSPSAAIPTGPTSNRVVVRGGFLIRAWRDARVCGGAARGDERMVSVGTIETGPDATLVSPARRCARAAEGWGMASSARC